MLLTRSAALFGLLVLACPGLTQNQAPNLFPDVTPIEGSFEGSERWIVHFEKRSFDLGGFRNAVWSGAGAEAVAEIVRDLEQRTKRDQAGFVRDVEALGGQVVAQWWLINGCAVDLPKGRIDTIRQLPNIALVEPDQVWEPHIKTATNASNHNADLLQSRGIKGLGVGVAIMDTGLDENRGNSGTPHRTFFIDGDTNNKTGNGIGGSRLVVNRRIGSMQADDVHGHGTGVASIVAGGKWATSSADHGHAYAADIAGYAIANNTRGSSSTTTMTNAWQSIASDKVQYNIVSANNSYSGSPNPLNSTQKALCAAARNADILISVSAGNSSARTTGSQICVNGLSVGAVSENNHNRASFQSYGTTDGQFYPDITANGVSTNMARRDNEGSDYVGSGTSMSSPQVCGAAAQIRGLFRNLRADETKAILLATSIPCQYTGSTQVNTGPGCGYLRNDYAFDAASNAKRHGRDKFDSSRKELKIGLPVEQGKDYQVAIAWHRNDENSSTWSNLDLRILDGTNTVISSTQSRNTEEFVRFTASRSTTLLIEITATTISGAQQEFAWAANADTAGSNYQQGAYDEFGTGCLGSVVVPVENGVVVPANARTSMGNSADALGVSLHDFRYQQLIDGGEMPAKMTILGYSLRQDDVNEGSVGGTQNYRVLFGYTKRSVATLGTNFDQNWDAGSPPVTVYSGTVNLPTLTGTNQDPNKFTSVVKFAAPFVYTKQAGENLLLEVQNSSSVSRNANFDAVTGGAVQSTRIFGIGATASTGYEQRNYGLVLRLDTYGSTTRVAPELAHSGTPEIERSFSVNLSNALPSSVGALLLGFSDSQWLAVSLPFDLGVAGMTGCQLLVSWDIMMPVGTDAQGDATVTIPIPKSKQLVGLTFHNQFFVLDAKANAGGISWSGGGTGKIGG